MRIVCFKKELRDEFVRERTLDIKAKNEMKLKRDEQDKASSSQQKTSPPSQSGLASACHPPPHWSTRPTNGSKACVGVGQ